MEKLAQYKGKNKKQPTAKQKSTKKRKSDGPSCSMFLAELTRKLAAKRRQEVESPINIIQTIIDSITNALPIKISKRSSPKIGSPIKIETLRSLSPELLPNDTLSVPHPNPIPSNDAVLLEELGASVTTEKSSFKMPKMPLVNSDVIRVAVEKRRKEVMTDASTSTAAVHDVASEIAKHVVTLKKISLIAEEFNQKTAKNLKEIVDSVQEDLIKKLDEIQAEEKSRALARAQIQQIQDANEDSD